MNQAVHDGETNVVRAKHYQRFLDLLYPQCTHGCNAIDERDQQRRRKLLVDLVSPVPGRAVAPLPGPPVQIRTKWWEFGHSKRWVSVEIEANALFPETYKDLVLFDSSFYTWLAPS